VVEFRGVGGGERVVFHGMAAHGAAPRQEKAELRRLLGFEIRYELDGFLKAHRRASNDMKQTDAG